MDTTGRIVFEKEKGKEPHIIASYQELFELMIRINSQFSLCADKGKKWVYTNVNIHGDKNQSSMKRFFLSSSLRLYLPGVFGLLDVNQRPNNVLALNTLIEPAKQIISSFLILKQEKSYLR